MKNCWFFLSCTSSPDPMIGADEGPSTASIADLSPAFTASYSAAPASCGEAKVFSPVSWAAAVTERSTPYSATMPTHNKIFQIRSLVFNISNLHQGFRNKSQQPN